MINEEGSQADGKHGGREEEEQDVELRLGVREALLGRKTENVTINPLVLRMCWRGRGLAGPTGIRDSVSYRVPVEAQLQKEKL